MTKRVDIFTLKFFLIFLFLATSTIWPILGLSSWHYISLLFVFSTLFYAVSKYIISLVLYLSILTFFWYVVPAIQIHTGVRFYKLQDSIQDFDSRALIFIIIHMIGILIGCKFAKLRFKTYRYIKKRLSILGIFTAVSICIILLFYIGIENILLSRAEQQEFSIKNVPTFFIFLEIITKLLPAFLLSYLILQGDQGISKSIWIILILLISIIMLIISNPINTGRFISLTGFLIVFLTFFLKLKKHLFTIWILTLTPFYAIFILILSSLARAGFQNIDMEKIFISLQTLEFSSYSVFIDGLAIDSFPKDNYLFSHLFILIPRSIWQNKSDSIGVFIAENSEYVFTNVGAVSFLNSYADFGWVGLFIVSFIFGLICKLLNPINHVASFKNRRFSYGIIFTSLTPMIFRGDLSTAMIGLYSAILSYEVVRFCTRLTVK